MYVHNRILHTRSFTVRMRTMAEEEAPGEAEKLAVTKVVTLRDFEQNDPLPPPEKWVKCFRVDDSLQELSTNIMKDWEFPNTSHVLLHIDVPNQQLYHLPLLITPVHCVYLITFDLREEKKALKRIHEAMKHIFAFVSYNSKSLLENYSPPKVLLVGTHKTADQKIQFVQKLRESLKKYRGLIVKPGDEEFWAVDGDFIDIQNSNIFNEIRLHSCRPQVPTCRCIEYGSELLQKFLETNVVLPCVSSTEVKKFLAFLHDYGFIVYSRDQELREDDTPVVLQPQYLCELFAKAQELSKKWDAEVTVEGLFSSNAKLERSIKEWFEMFCIHMGLVIEQPMRDGRSLVFVLSRQPRSETASLATHIYSVDPLLVTYKPRAKDIDCFIPPRFFPAFASKFLKFLHERKECKDKLTVSINQSQAQIVVDWDVGCHIHVLEQESCIEIGFQLDAVNWNEHKTQPKFKKLQKRCQIVKTVVCQSAEDAVMKLNMPGGDACVEYGFYHLCGGATVIGIRVSDEDETALQCCCSCRGIPSTPMQDIWFQDVMDCKVHLQRHEADSEILKLVDGADPLQLTPPPQSTTEQQSTPGQKAQQVLDQFRSRFMKYVDAEAIIYQLMYKKIIGDGDITTITSVCGASEKNQRFHYVLWTKCTEEALTVVCDTIIAVQGNSQMKKLGEEMKSMLEDLLRGAPST